MRRLFALCVVTVACVSQKAPPPAAPDVPSSAASASAPAVSVASVAASASAAPMAAKRLSVVLVPIGDVDDETMAQASRGLVEHAPVRVTIHARQALPSFAQTSEKARYRAGDLLRFLEKLAIAGNGKVMGVTDVDIVTPKNGVPNWGILGLGAMDGKVSVLSTYRMKRKFEGGGVSDAVARERLWKISVHELGHTLGLDHCPNKGCLMEDAHGTVKTVDAETTLCPRCTGLYADAVGKLAE